MIALNAFGQRAAVIALVVLVALFTVKHLFRARRANAELQRRAERAP